MAVRLVVFGRQGAGKGTQCVRLSSTTAPRTSPPATCSARPSPRAPTSAARPRSTLDAGELLPDDIMLGVVEDRLTKPDVVEHGFLLDGFPRTVGQAEALIGLAAIDLAINLEVPEDLVHRERDAWLRPHLLATTPPRGLRSRHAVALDDLTRHRTTELRPSRSSLLRRPRPAGHRRRRRRAWTRSSARLLRRHRRASLAS